MKSTYQCKKCKYEFESVVSLILDQLKKGSVLRCPKCHSTHLKELIKYQKPRRLREIEDFDRPLTQDREAFLKAQPFVCDNCKKFTDILREYCENCGGKDSLRIATKDDFNQRIKIAEPISEVYQLKAEEAQLQPPISEGDERKGTYCVHCGANIEEGRPYCHNCGKLVLKIKPEEKQVNQPLIIEPIEEEVLVEKELVAEELIEEEILPEEEVVVKEQIEEIFFFCKFCGIKLDKKASFCTQCGTAVKRK